MNAPRRALIIIDVQQEYFEGLLPIQYPDRDTSIANIVKAVDTAGQAGLPIAVIQHELPEGAPVFAKGTPGWNLHPEVAARFSTSWKHGTKAVASVFEDAGLVQWLRDNDVDTVTLVGYMTNNCVIGSAAGAEPLGFAVEVLSDATGAVHLLNEAGSVPAQQVHETLMVVLHSNFAAVASTTAWENAIGQNAGLPKSDLGSSILAGQAAFTAVSAP
ncbi:nicotinamidase-related amidase [Arthrobacter sp. V4I6]|uniref:isochorismatase family protein n=1 Tax=unclassified Arthrobacter TaxID=235627 RepID=UPI0027876D95|nr:MULTISPECIES: isochorismatase family protein [unclassified Arthrobacter]MDQ0821729.1 nicotinamidase-related amidase [Arthrobacter sp. V1I7]MDQ0855993.1 nicotinamidase-related amidase [Arthrobacter sp. V4I6]